MSGMDVGLHGTVREAPPTRTYVVTSGARRLDRLEDGEVRCWPDTHVFMLNEATGDVMVHGDRGTFAACWPAAHRGAGTSLHAFLARVRFDYFMGKALEGDHTEIDAAATLDDMRREVLRERRGGWISAADARSMRDALHEDIHDSMDERAFTEALYDDRLLSERFCDGGVPFVRRPVERLRIFWDEAWATFRREVLLPRVAAERAGSDDVAVAQGA